MKNFQNCLLMALMALIFGCSAPEETKTETGKTGYDAELATKLQADPYGMRQYVMAFLKKGPNRDQDSLSAANLQRAHLENIGRLAEAGKLSLAGPFLDEGEIRGIYIFNVTDPAEARRLTETDPAIQAGSLIMELRPWYGSAALQEVNNLHAKLEKQNIAE